MKGLGLILFAGITLALLWALARPKQAAASVVRTAGVGSGDVASGDRTMSGEAWYTYWSGILRDVYKSVGAMPPQGPDTICMNFIPDGCIQQGTPTPESP